MQHVASPGPTRLRVLSSAFLKPLRRLIKKQLNITRNPALSWVADHAARLRRLTLRRTTFIGITGSCGKTTTTLLTGEVLSAKAPCHVKAWASSHYSVTRTILSLAPSTRFCVHELGAYEPGSIARAVKILSPQIGIVTMIGMDHYRQFRGLEGVAKEKSALIERLPSTGMAILNIDDTYVAAMASRTRATVLTFGCSMEADVRASDISSAWPDRLSLTVIHGEQMERIHTRLVGEHWVPSVLAAVTCGIACGVTLKDSARAIEVIEPAFGRYSVHTLDSGPDYIFDHKAPYWTIASSLDFLAKARARRKTIVFGTISDYPGSASKRYRRVARAALEVADRVVFVGPHSGHVERMRTEDLRSRLLGFPTVYQASNYLAQNVLPEELVLIRGSPAADHLERIMLSQLDRVVCWREGCGRFNACPECSAYRKSTPPPFGLADSQTTVTSAGDELSERQPASMVGG